MFGVPPCDACSVPSAPQQAEISITISTQTEPEPEPTFEGNGFRHMEIVNNSIRSIGTIANQLEAARKWCKVNVKIIMLLVIAVLLLLVAYQHFGNQIDRTQMMELQNYRNESNKRMTTKSNDVDGIWNPL